jgi:hypothetical protein
MVTVRHRVFPPGLTPILVPPTYSIHAPNLIAVGRLAHVRWLLLRLTRIIHEGFYCNRRYAVPTGVLATQSVNILFRDRLRRRRCLSRFGRGQAPRADAEKGVSPPAALARLTTRLSGFVTNPRE